MQDSPLSRWLSPLMAFCLSLVIIVTLAPAVGIQIDRQLDFWLLWLGSMVILALPVCYLEIALARRSKTTALNALSRLTRDADASSKWRLVGWLAVVFIAFLAGGILSHASMLLPQQFTLGVAPNLLLIVLAVLAFGLSFVSRQILLLITAIALIASIALGQVYDAAQLQPWHWTSLEFKEWGNATVLALVASGLGMGLYWQTTVKQVDQQTSASASVLPIWLAQLVAVIAFGFVSIQQTVPVLTWVVAALMASALLLQLAREQLIERQAALALQWAVPVVAVVIWAIPAIQAEFYILTMLWGLLLCLIYAIFAGWIMKISHLRKSMNFSSELFYNLWRIAVRIVLPLGIVLAMISVLGQLFT
ncbi:hypothetical protein [Acinetobacter soli]|uniref:hypothetical protein n=1 Tax=Acinetobacter soli TaxID=487316 RepID=UPI0014866838|nr:hypothetical protein [Acinetobacter soli]